MFRMALVAFVTVFLGADALSPIGGQPLWQQAYQGGTKLALEAVGMDQHPLVQKRAKGTFPKFPRSILSDPRNAEMVARFREIDAISRHDRREDFEFRNGRYRGRIGGFDRGSFGRR